MNEINILSFFVACVVANNFIFNRFLGVCPFLGVSKQVSTAFGMGVAVTFVMTLASLFTYFVYYGVLVTLNIEFMSTISFILVIATLVQFLEMAIKKFFPALYPSFGIYLPLITTNCAVLGVTVININESYNLLYSVMNGFFGALGFTLAIVLMAGVRERLENSNIPESMKGFPISLVSACLMAIGFMGFAGI